MISEKTDYRKYLDPAFVSKLKSLELKAKMVVEGFMVGLHKSPYHGFSVEFSEHRSYNQGDPIKNIDWKVYGKSERFYIKQYEEETNLICSVLIDISKSMDFKNEGAITKLEYANTLAAGLIYLMQQQQDATGLTLYSDKIEKQLPPKSNRVYLKTLLTAIEAVEPSNQTNTAACLFEVAEKIKKRGLVIVLSDLFDDPKKIIDSLKRLHFKKNEVIVFQILDPIEKSFAFGKDAIFVDKETDEEMTTQPYQIQRAYQESLAEYIEHIKTECLNNGIEYNLIDTSTPYDKAIFSYFKKRSRLN
ncbi:MAG: DUF58 domain-containing protein [Melioribacteraceae bacterium]|nr:DUF58 domain-containing protein [Melioribacteraceae bacterium]MCF8355088.1 DUF58 domain-containing protein [Melioribacteraceae bacterium]MCF8395056.1 DUF58 domain-containing protein [Melioribacteraceae bacterium]MCF8420306.1 DUF58 domain-containing protein [Melioribacteraceae bacterium]